MIKFSHTLFAMPFALLAMMLAARDAVPAGWPGWPTFLLIIACMVTARNAAMGFNRLADRDIDAANPRTSGRELPAGVLSAGWVGGFVAVNAALFLAFAFMLNTLAGLLAPAALALVLLYSHSKRFLAATHFMLGLGLALAPLGAWIAVRGNLEGAPWLLALAVLLWVAGFDIIYACQDIDFDRRARLRSIPAALGPGRALGLAALCHAGMIAALVLFARIAGLGAVWFGGIAIAALLLLWEHRVVRGGDLSRIDLAFFRINSAVGMVVLTSGALDILLG